MVRRRFGMAHDIAVLVFDPRAAFWRRDRALVSGSVQMRADSGRLEEIATVLAKKQPLAAKEVAYLDGRLGPVLARVIDRYRTHADKLEQKGK